MESLRALAALGVLTGHTLLGVYPGQPHGTYLLRAGFGAAFGVYLFFALSGYLLYLPFARRDFTGGAPIDIRRYALNRAVRILPLYFAVLAILLIVTQHGGSPFQWVTFATFTENLYGADVVNSFNDGPMWSLVVEVQFYVLLPVIALFVGRISRRSTPLAAALLAALGLASLFAHLPLGHAHGSSFRFEHSFVNCFAWFVPGMLIGLLTTTGRSSRLGRCRAIGSSTVWLTAAASAWLLAFWIDASGQSVAILAATFLSVGGCVLPLRPGFVSRVLGWRPLAMLGVASYSLYLWHSPIITRLHLVGVYPTGFLGRMLVNVPLCCTVALASYAIVERPFLRARRRWSSGTSTVSMKPPCADGGSAVMSPEAAVA